MDPLMLQDRIFRGLNAAARTVGADTDAYRASGNSEPLAATNRFLRLRAAFIPHRGGPTRPNAHGEALWHGIFDAAYTRVGDYLVQADCVWFIASQQRLLPVLCVKTNRIVSFRRPATPSTTGVNAYGGANSNLDDALLTNWPASILGTAGGGHPSADLPGDSSVPLWTGLLPAVSGVILLPADLMTDDLGRHSVVASSEPTELGWRISMKQVTT